VIRPAALSTTILPMKPNIGTINRALRIIIGLGLSTYGGGGKGGNGNCCGGGKCGS
jgi:hypothetical protein